MRRGNILKRTPAAVPATTRSTGPHYGREAESIRDGVREAGGPSEEPVPDPDSPPEPSSEPSEMTWETEDGQTAPDDPAEGEAWPIAEQEEDWPEPEMAEDGPLRGI